MLRDWQLPASFTRSAAGAGAAARPRQGRGTTSASCSCWPSTRWSACSKRSRPAGPDESHAERIAAEVQRLAEPGRRARRPSVTTAMVNTRSRGPTWAVQPTSLSRRIEDGR